MTGYWQGDIRASSRLLTFLLGLVDNITFQSGTSNYIFLTYNLFKNSSDNISVCVYSLTQREIGGGCVRAFIPFLKMHPDWFFYFRANWIVFPPALTSKISLLIITVASIPSLNERGFIVLGTVPKMDKKIPSPKYCLWFVLKLASEVGTDSVNSSAQT